MSMKNIIPIVLLLSLIIFSVVIANGNDGTHSAENSLFCGTLDNSAKQIGDAGEEPLSWNNVVFTALPVCKKDEDYTDGNDVLSVYDVYWGSNKVSMTIALNNFNHGISNVLFTFKGRSLTTKMRLPECLPGIGYRITISWKDNEFCLYDCTWSGSSSIRLSDAEEFGGSVVLLGPNTIRYKCLHSRVIYVLDQTDTVIERLVLHGIGEKKIRFGARKYEEVKMSDDG